ncbi:polyhydroxybutyrate depolymerase [Sulfitobacter undariae]|uniref:Polyhydroxybutyrate depolymerase n=1 Tax=Sulfitobacter undariae TaxID=1563671 RepID=A0A7W6E7B6_9RHOB|nr:polyhydroxybutyrate depolymerase [Sulfitobacter undariae]MBB3994781.1 polyhydroxybutyrate depolymerase [Sulfitobacter undariae]
MGFFKSLRPYVVFLVALMTAPIAYACGADSDCIVGDRVYRISLPEGAEKPMGAVIWAHGYGGSAAGAMRNLSLRKMVHAQGLALIAAQGVDGNWDLPNGPRTPDSTGAAEFAYFDAVIADATTRFSINPNRLVASGFSAGGMMVWNLACAQPQKFVGYVPISGTYWKAPPASCATPAASIVHIHGDRDTTVPLEGRAIGQTRQGRVAEALEMYANFGEFGPKTTRKLDMFTCTTQGNPDGEILEFCLFKGGHSFRTEYLGYALDRLKAASQL